MMSSEQLELRLTANEKELAELRHLVNGPSPNTKWWEVSREPMSPEEEEAFQAMVEYGRYFRKTGRDAPPDWKPGDPIPEPDYDE